MEGKFQLCYLQGIASEYQDYFGNTQIVPQSVRDTLLLACGHRLDDAYCEAQNSELDAVPWTGLAPGFQITPQQNASIDVFASSGEQQNVSIRVETANGECLIDTLISPLQHREIGDYLLHNVRYSKHAVSLGTLPVGYYTAYLSRGNEQAKVTLVCYPSAAYNPNQNEKLWGVSLQLYSVNSDTNFGTGDFNDLMVLISLSAQRGADFVLLNPLHKLFRTNPESASPYSPSDRFQLNPLYISPKLCADFTDELTLVGNRDAFINYSAVSECKYAIFERMFARFTEHDINQNTERATVFNQFCEQHQDWQLDTFEYYLQWLAHTQLANCQSYSRELGMKIGLVTDLAVGCNGAGEEFARYNEIYSQQASIGAPPDPWAIDGQNWGMPVIDPLKLKASGYAHFIALIRANMQHCGALRIDHIMGLLRLWWCVSIENKAHGCYMYYPFKELWAILLTESVLNQCAVIGEDLGVVPTQIVEAMTQGSVLGNDIFYFEKHHNGHYKLPQSLREPCLLMLANHDVAPFKQWWLGGDINLKASLGLYSCEQVVAHDLAQREADKSALLSWLENVHKRDFGELEPIELYKQIMLSLATAPAQLVCLQLDDLSGEEQPINIPGTDTEYSNWRRRLSLPLADIFSDDGFFCQLTNGRNNAK